MVCDVMEVGEGLEKRERDRDGDGDGGGGGMWREDGSATVGKAREGVGVETIGIRRGSTSAEMAPWPHSSDIFSLSCADRCRRQSA